MICFGNFEMINSKKFIGSSKIKIVYLSKNFRFLFMLDVHNFFMHYTITIWKTCNQSGIKAHF